VVAGKPCVSENSSCLFANTLVFDFGRLGTNALDSLSPALWAQAVGVQAMRSIRILWRERARTSSHCADASREAFVPRFSQRPTIPLLSRAGSGGELGSFQRRYQYVYFVVVINSMRERRPDVARFGVKLFRGHFLHQSGRGTVQSESGISGLLNGLPRRYAPQRRHHRTATPAESASPSSTSAVT
jgi:hypothetical protein